MGMTKDELTKILALHKNWINNKSESVRADLSGVDLFGVDLTDVNLRYVDLSGACLRHVDLRDANLEGAYLNSADLTGADLTDANLSEADLRCVDLSQADLSNANLRGAYLNWVNWHEAKGLKVYLAQLNSSRENAQLVYIPSLDVTTTGCWQGTWKETKNRVKKVYKDANPSIYKKYKLAFKYIEEQMEADHDD